MTLYEWINEKAHNNWESFKWHLKFSSLFTMMSYPYWWVVQRDRGRDFPYYLVDEREAVVHAVKESVGIIDDFIHNHEPEMDKGEGAYGQHYLNRLKYVFKNFHYYSNETIANLYFQTKLPLGDYQRIKNVYNHYYFTWLGYNSLSGIFLVALNNYFFRCRKVTLPVVFLASLTTFAMISANYKVSECIMNYGLNQYVRRLGYKEHVYSGRSYPRNIDYIANY